MNVQYVEFNGKHPKEKKENRSYYSTPKKKWDSYGIKYPADYLRIDIDDYDHKTEELDEPIREKARSNAIIELLNKSGISYIGIITEHGKHLIFKRPLKIERSYDNWYSVIGVKFETKVPTETNDEHIPLKVNGNKREFFKGSLESEPDELPFFLYPLQKSKTKGFDITFPRGDRTQQLGAYLFHLVNEKGFSADQSFDIVRYMNEYVFNDPIPVNKLETEILNKSTFEKLKTIQKEAENKALTHVDIADIIINKYNLITVNGDFYTYDNGVYKPISTEEILSFICINYPDKKTNMRKEILEFIRGKTYKKIEQLDTGINVRNGILRIAENGTVSLEAHSPDNIFLKQFNAVYDPNAKCELLHETLLKIFDNSKEQLHSFNELLGYLLMNHVDFQKIFFFIGEPSSGKSCLLHLLTYFCGKDNVSSISLSDMNETFGLEPLINKTVNIFSDLPKTKMLKSDTFKLLADGSQITIKRKYKTPIQYRFTGKLIFGTNQCVDFSNDFEGISRRIQHYKFTHVFKNTDPDYNPHIVSDLCTDEAMSVFLNMAMEGYKSLINNKGFTETKENIAAREELICENNNVLYWIKESDYEEDYFIREPIRYGTQGTYMEYVGFCHGIGEEPKAQKDFTKTICKKYGLKAVRKRSGGSEKIPFFVK